MSTASLRRVLRRAGRCAELTIGLFDISASIGPLKGLVIWLDKYDRPPIARSDGQTAVEFLNELLRRGGDTFETFNLNGQATEQKASQKNALWVVPSEAT